MKRLFVLSLLFLAACNTQAPSIPVETPTSNPSVQPNSDSIFSKALSSHSLSLDLFQQGTSDNQGAVSPTAGNPAESAAAPAPSLDKASGRMMAPWYGGGEFNNYVLQYVEESIFPAAQAKTLLTAYKEAVEPLLSEWDSQGRLIESRANLGDGVSKEMLYYLPGVNGEPTQLKINYLFRLASSKRKETLVIYLTDEKTHVHRMVWGEPNLDLSNVKIDSQEAKKIALKAFADKDLSGDQVYPQEISSEMQVYYDIPADAHWQLYLNQQGQTSAVYFVHVNFEARVEIPEGLPTPPDYPKDVELIDPVPDTPVSGASDPDDSASNDSNEPRSQIQSFYGSAQIDAKSGKIISLDRPVFYTHSYYPSMPMPVLIDSGMVSAPPEAAPPAAQL